MNIDLKELGGRVRSARIKLDMTQNDLAEKAQMHPTYLSEIENGKVNMSIDVFARLTEALQVSADWLLQSDVPSVNALQTNEIVDLLSDCSATEKNAIIKMIKEIKLTLHATTKE